MRKNKLLKIMMSAAVMASMAAIPAQAEGPDSELPAEHAVQAGNRGEDTDRETIEEQEKRREPRREIGPGISGWENTNQETIKEQEKKKEPRREIGPGIPVWEDREQERAEETGRKDEDGQDKELDGDQLMEAEYFAQGMALVEEFVMTGGNLEEAVAEDAQGTGNEAAAAGQEGNQEDDQKDEVPPKGPGYVKTKARKEDDGWQKHEKKEYGPHCILLVNEEEQEEEEETVTPYTEEDLDVLAHAICGEGQCCPDDEQLYIGSVILNRRSHAAYPDTIKGVVFQRGQYSCTRDGNYYREPTEANWRNARWLLENGSILPGNVVYQAGFRQGSGLYLQTRYHKYCYR